MMINCKGSIVRNDIYAPLCHCLGIKVPYQSKIVAGQFVYVLVQKTTYPLLRRPFSIYDVESENKNGSTIFDILFRVVGKGTEILAQKKPSDNVDFLGPLGNGFSVSKSSEMVIFIAGGMGIVPLHLAARQLKMKEPQKKLMLFWGAKTRSEFGGLGNFEKLGLDIFLSTEDGSLGKKGQITTFAETYLSGFDNTITKRVEAYACGPVPMLNKIIEIVKAKKIRCQVSLESKMACGLGACGGCAVKLDMGDGHFRYSRVCSEGPVYKIV